MVNIFGFKLFESASIEEQMHFKNRSRRPHHFKNRSRHKHHFKNKSRRNHLKGGYMYDDNNLAGQDITASLSGATSNTSNNSTTKRKNGHKARGHSKAKKQ